jgi:hypothetical protein
MQSKTLYKSSSMFNTRDMAIEISLPLSDEDRKISGITKFVRAASELWKGKKNDSPFMRIPEKDDNPNMGARYIMKDSSNGATVGNCLEFLNNRDIPPGSCIELPTRTANSTS